MLAGTEEETERLALLVNLGIAEFRTAKRENSPEAAEAAKRMWYEGEQIAAENGLLEEWAISRMFQTEAELLIYEIRGDTEWLSSALKRQIETSMDTQGALSLGTMRSVFTWLSRAEEARYGRLELESCLQTTGHRRAVDFDGRDGICAGLEEMGWTDQEYREREERTEQWLGIARASGDETTVAHMIGVRADQLRKRGLRENEPGLLITSFEATHEFRTRTGIIDEGIAEGELIIRSPEAVALVELEASLALACADRDYMRRLTKEIAMAELWCRQDNIQHCEARQSWRNDVMAALEYGIESWEVPSAIEVDQTEVLEDGTAEVWRHAVWVRNKGAELGLAESLCQNRPQGIAEGEEQRKNIRVNDRTLAYQKIPRTVSCVLSPQLSTSAPSLPSNAEKVEEWRRDVEAWIEESHGQFQRDVQTIKECEGEPW